MAGAICNGDSVFQGPFHKPNCTEGAGLVYYNQVDEVTSAINEVLNLFKSSSVRSLGYLSQHSWWFVLFRLWSFWNIFKFNACSHSSGRTWNNCLSARRNSKIDRENWGQNTEGRSTLRVFHLINLDAGGPTYLSVDPWSMKALWCIYVKLIYSMCSTWNQCNFGHHERYVGNLKGILFRMTVFAYVLHHFFGNLFKSLWLSRSWAIFNTLPQKPNESKPSESHAVWPWGIFHIFSFLGFGWFRPDFATGRSGGATAGGPMDEILSNWMQLENWWVEVSIWGFIKDKMVKQSEWWSLLVSTFCGLFVVELRHRLLNC